MTNSSQKTLDAHAQEVLAALTREGTYRQLRRIDGLQGARMCVDGHEALIFAGSNYLDLAAHPALIEASTRSTQECGAAAGGSRLIQGNLTLHEALEAELAEFFGSEAALVFNTGYMANLGVITALAAPGDAIVSDALNHASIIDACRLARATTRVFGHSDPASLEAVLRELASGAEKPGKIFLVVDGVYSMDGDVAPLERMVEIAKRYGAFVILDDAHGVGTLGKNGRGSAELFGDAVERAIDLRIGTLGKSLGSFGAFVTCTKAVREWLINTARSFIFSCALSPGSVGAARAALRLVREEPWRRERLQANAARLRRQLAKAGFSSAPSTTQIIPLIVGENAATMALGERLLARGFFAQGIRHPSVPRGTARLRLTVMATHQESEIDALVAAIEDEWGKS